LAADAITAFIMGQLSKCGHLELKGFGLASLILSLLICPGFFYFKKIQILNRFYNVMAEGRFC
jgi:hypothetical protein